MDVLDPADDERQEPVLEYACHEGNQAIKNILSAARTAEREAAKDEPSTACSASAI